MKNKKIILNLLISFVMVFVVAFGFGLKSNLSKANALPAEEKHIDFTPVVTVVYNEDTNNDQVNDVLLVSSAQNEFTLTVSYKVVYNDGISNLVLVPKYNKSVFSIVSYDVNEDTLLGDAVVTGTEVDADALKVAFASSNKYVGVTTEQHDEVLLTVTFAVNAEYFFNDYEIEDLYDTFTFGLVDDGENYNDNTKANVILDQENIGDQTPVAVNVVAESAENTVRIAKLRDAEIEFGYNYYSTTGTSYDYWYEFVYSKTALAYDQVEVLRELYEEEEQLTNNEPYFGLCCSAEIAESYSGKVEFTYSGSAPTLNIDWYTFDGENYTALQGAPMYFGTYYLGVSAPANGVYRAVETQYRRVEILRAYVTVTIYDKTSAYKDAIVPLTYSTSRDACQGDNFGIVLSTTATSASNPENYPITGSAGNTGAVNADQYIIGFTNESGNAEHGTYTITKKTITIHALNQSATYTGSEPEVLKREYDAQQEQYVYYYEVTAGDVSEESIYDIVTITKAVGVNAGQYTLTPGLNNSNYILTPVPGTFTITSVGKDAEYIASFFEGVEKTYNGKNQALYQTKAGIPSWLNNHSAEPKKDAATYNNVSITITVSEQDAKNYIDVNLSGSQTYYATVNSLINPYNLPVIAANHGHTYGSTPETLTPASVQGVQLTDGDNPTYETVTVTFAVKDGNNNAVTLADTTNVGTYTINPIVADTNYNLIPTAGTYTVSQALVRDVDGEVGPDDADPNAQEHAVGVKISVSGEDRIYNRGNVVSHKVMVGNLTLTEGEDYTVVVTKLNDQQQPVEVNLANVLDVGTYTITVTVTGNDNYVGATKSAEFDIMYAVLAVPEEITYNKATATWSAVTKTNMGDDLLDGTIVTYKIGGTAYPGRSFTATSAGDYELIIESSNNPNYALSQKTLDKVYEVAFNEGSHDRNNGHASNMPSPQYRFAGETADAPQSNPTIDGYSFKRWELNSAEYNFSSLVNSDLTIYATWTEAVYTVTVNYIVTDPYQATEGARYQEDVRIYKNSEGTHGFDLRYNDRIDGSQDYMSDIFDYVKGDSVVADIYQAKLPQYETLAQLEASDYGNVYELKGWTYKTSVEDEGTYYTIEQLTSSQSQLQITSNCSLTAVYEVVDHLSFEITYYISTDEKGYVAQQSKTTVEYTEAITYNTLSTNVRWFATSGLWFANESRTTSALPVMPNHDINVYGSYDFNVGLGDVNGNGSVDTNDITLYRQWIVGGYEMIVIEDGQEWAYATENNLVNLQNYPSTPRYYLKRVADNNKDENRDIRDVSVTRMAIVGGYTWNIESHLNVTGEEITRSDRPLSLSALESSLESGKKVRLVQSLSGADLVISSDKDMYLDLAGYTLTVKSFSISSNANVTITIFNGTIVTTDGITISAPNGSVVLQDLDGYDANGAVNLAAFNHSLHINKNVRFIVGAPAEEPEQQQEQQQPAPVVLAPVNIAKGTHVVIEQAATLEVAKVVVVAVAVDQTSEQPTAFTPIENPTQADFITLDNYSVEVDVAEDLVFEGNVVDNSEISTLDQLKEAAKNGGTYKLVADIEWTSSSSDGNRVCFENNTVLDLNDHILRNTNDVALRVVNGATLTLNGDEDGKVYAQEACVMAFYGSEVVINGGSYTAYDNFVVGTNGSNGQGGNTITINGGVFNGGIQTTGYVACGIYVANSDTVTVNAGTFNITNGAGILARSGNTTVKGGTFNVTGNGQLGKVGDSKVTVPSGAVLVLDYAANYPGGEPSLTNETEYDVITLVASEAKLREALEVGGNIKLLADIDLSATLVVTNNITLDLNNHTLYNTADIWDKLPGNWSLVSVRENGDLTIDGNGLLDAKADDCYAIDVQDAGATLTINGGEYHGNISAVYVYDGLATINGGHYSIKQLSNNETEKHRFTLNLLDEHRTAGTARIVVNGGSFENFNPSNNLAEGPKTNFVAAGLVVSASNDIYTVTAGNALASVSDLVTAITYGGSYVLMADVVYNGQASFAHDTTIELNGYKLKSSDNVALSATNGATLTLNGNGEVEAQEACVMAFYGSTVVINGGTYTSYDNFVVGTNGTVKQGDDQGHNTITINGGVFNGGIQTAGYVACGIYVANSDTVTVNAGKFNVTNGVGILARSGNTTVGANVELNVTGNGELGKVGDSRVVLPSGAELVLDLAANYPGGVPTLTNSTNYEVYTINAQ